MIDWNPCKPINETFINDERLTNQSQRILITTLDAKGKRRVMIVRCNYGKILKKFEGRIIAWAYEPTPYR